LEEVKLKRNKTLADSKKHTRTKLDALFNTLLIF
jgi:hypothetical protein